MTDQEIKLLRHVLGMHETTRVPVQNGMSAKYAARYRDVVDSLFFRGLLEHHPGGGHKEYMATKLGIRRAIDQPWK